jgi:hypothetical protein
MVTDNQVARVDASRIVALVQDKCAFWYGAIGVFVRQAVRQLWHPAVRTPDRKLTITETVCAGRPQPAFIWVALGDFAPKSSIEHEVSSYE